MQNLHSSLSTNYFYDSNSYSPKMREKYIQTDMELISICLENRKKFFEISEGDFLRFKDGSLMRVTVLYDNDLQFNYGGSFHLSSNGHCSFSGTCGNLLPISDFAPTDETEEGSAWIFSQGRSGGGRGVYFRVPFKVWEQINGDYSPKKEANDHLYYVQVVGEKELERFNNYKYLIDRGGTREAAFRNDNSFNEWVKENGLVKTKGSWGDSYFMGKEKYL